MSNLHIPVLLNETLNVLNVRPDGIYVDCTAGRGGHSAEIIKRIKTGKLVCIDNDADSIAYIKEKFKNENRVIIVKDNFANLSRILQTLRITKVDGILLDLGASSPMYDNLGRGFSYHHDAKLDMRFDQTQKVDALYVINNYTAAQLNTIFINFGEIKFPYRTTKAIIAARTEKPITTTKELVDLIKKNLAWKILKKEQHPARKYFQAIRMEVNQELNNLKNVLSQIPPLVNYLGTVAVITFHSLEDRIVKSAFTNWTTDHTPKEVPIMFSKSVFNLITRKPITASKEELANNPRSRSAKLRGVIKN